MADRSMWERMKGAAMLDVATYEEVEHDESLTTQAAIVVLLARMGRGHVSDRRQAAEGNRHVG